MLEAGIRMKKYAVLYLRAFVLAVAVCAGAQENESILQTGPAKLFTFTYRKDDTYRILSRVNEDVSVNNVEDHHSEIVSRVSVHVVDVDTTGNGTHEASFMTSDEAENSVSGKHFTWNKEYHSRYVQSPLGIITINGQYFMPVVRNMPVFPARPLKPGDVWTETGFEAHDLRRTFNLQTPFIVPFTATYTYTGIIQDNDGKAFDVFTASYPLSYETPVPDKASGQPYADYPVSTLGYSNRTIYWDSRKGNVSRYDETFRINIVTSYGTVYKFSGTAHAEITEFKRTATDDNVRQVQSAVQQMNLPDVTVQAGEQGLTFRLENIQFDADSAVLPESEQTKLRKIAELLKAYPDNDLLVTGHTALAGTETTRQQLSAQRAQAVAEYLINLGVRDAYHIFTCGKGASVPIASNETEEGKAKNRRVEITILDK